MRCAGCPQAGWGLCINDRVMKHLLLVLVLAGARVLLSVVQHGCE